MTALKRARLRMANLGDEMALCFDDEVLCEGSDEEDSPLAKAERQKRREAIELRYLAGHAPLIMSAQLRGPFDKNSGWVNPWRSKRPTQKQPRNRATATEPLNIAHETTVVCLGKRSRNDGNSSSSAGMRTKALAECSATSMDIVNNRQPERPQLYSGFKRFAANQLERPTDFANLNERENIPQKLNAGIKRRADTNWLKGADVGKRPRNSWSDPTSPTPKERTRDIASNDKAIIDASSMFMSNTNIAKFNRHQPAETASLSEFEDIPISTADSVRSIRAAAQRHSDEDIQPTPYATAKTAEDKSREISMGRESPSRSPSACTGAPPNSERPHMESATNAGSVDGDESDSAIEIGRKAPEYSLNRSSFVEPESSFGHKSVQSCASLASFEPSPVHSWSRSQLSQEILHGLSQASQLARSAEQLTPLKPSDSTLNIVEHHPSDLAKRNSPSFSSKKTPSQISSASLNHASQTRSQSQPVPKNPMEAKLLKPERNDRSRSFDSPLPPGSLKYRKVRRKAPTPAKDRHDSDTSKVIGKQKTPEEAPLHPIEVQDETCTKSEVSAASQDLNYVNLAKPQFPTSDSGQLPPDSVPIIEISDNDASEDSKAQPLDRDIDNQPPTHTSVPPITPAIEDEANELDTGHESCPKTITNGCGSENSFDAPSMRCQESRENEGLLASQKAPGSQPHPIEAEAKTNGGGVERREEVPSSKATTSIVVEEPSLEDVTLSHDAGSPLAAPELTDNESTLGQMLQAHAAEGPNLKSSPLPPIPGIVDDDQLSEASFVSATEESSSKPLPAPAAVDGDQVSEASFTSAPEVVDSIPVPQSPWAAEVDVPAPQSVSAEPTLGPGNFSMSQSKDAAQLFVDTEPHCSTAESPSNDVKLSDQNSESLNRNAESTDRNSEPPYSNGIAFKGPSSSGFKPTRSILLPPKHLSQRNSCSPQSAKVGNHDLLSQSNPWVNSTQSPKTDSRPTRRKKRVSFNPLQLDSDNEDANDNQPKFDHPSNNAPQSRDLSSPPPPPEAESLTEGDNAFHRKLKWTSGILSNRASKDRFGSVSTENAILPRSPGVGAMAEAFLAADARIQSGPSIPREVRGNKLVAESENFNGLVENGEKQDEVITAPAVRAIPMMTESQLINPWGDEDEAPPFSMADCGPEEDNGLVEDVLSDMDAMLGGWNVDVELDRAKREGRGKTERDVTARERLVGTGY
ncbi:hypothetical protein V498_07108 [Pseudogymnoascus sp. VKM F-4517 (FW-2822)]|nr:hypothetical protein V498_07108 [Pseudogymnoascus sp. VKM F-4517 (FW-2822)]